MAGITCGHFCIPFATFFGATAIGKAIIKVHLQMVFVILTFSKHHVEVILGLIERNLPFLKHSLSQQLEKQKKMLWSSKDAVDMDEVIYIYLIYMLQYLIYTLYISYIYYKFRVNR